MTFEYAEPEDMADAELRAGALEADIELIRLQLEDTYEEWDKVNQYGEKKTYGEFQAWHKSAKFAQTLKYAELKRIQAWMRAEKIREKERNRKMMIENAERGAEVRRLKEDRLSRAQMVLESDNANDCVYTLWQSAREALFGNADALTWEVVDPVNDWLRSRGYLRDEKRAGA